MFPRPLNSLVEAARSRGSLLRGVFALSAVIGGIVVAHLTGSSPETTPAPPAKVAAKIAPAVDETDARVKPTGGDPHEVREIGSLPPVRFGDIDTTDLSEEDLLLVKLSVDLMDVGELQRMQDLRQARALR